MQNARSFDELASNWLFSNARRYQVILDDILIRLTAYHDIPLTVFDKDNGWTTNPVVVARHGSSYTHLCKLQRVGRHFPLLAGPDARRRLPGARHPPCRHRLRRHRGPAAAVRAALRLQGLVHHGSARGDLDLRELDQPGRASRVVRHEAAHLAFARTHTPEESAGHSGPSEEFALAFENANRRVKVGHSTSTAADEPRDPGSSTHRTKEATR